MAIQWLSQNHKSRITPNILPVFAAWVIEQDRKLRIDTEEEKTELHELIRDAVQFGFDTSDQIRKDLIKIAHFIMENYPNAMEEDPDINLSDIVIPLLKKGMVMNGFTLQDTGSSPSDDPPSGDHVSGGQGKI